MTPLFIGRLDDAHPCAMAMLDSLPSGYRSLNTSGDAEAAGERDPRCGSAYILVAEAGLSERCRPRVLRGGTLGLINTMKRCPLVSPPDMARQTVNAGKQRTLVDCTRVENVFYLSTSAGCNCPGLH